MAGEINNEIKKTENIEKNPQNNNNEDYLKQAKVLLKEVSDLVLKSKFITDYKEVKNQTYRYLNEISQNSKQSLFYLRRQVEESKIIYDQAEKAKNFYVGREKLRKSYSYAVEKYEEAQKDYFEKLSKLEKSLENNIDFKEKDIPFYIENHDQISLVDDEEYLLKIIKYENENNIRVKTSIKDINPKFRNNINILSKLNTTFDYDDLVLIDKDLLKIPENAGKILLKTSNDIPNFFLILKDIVGDNNIIDFITKILDLKEIKEKEKNVLFEDYYKYVIPNIIKVLDKDNKLKRFDNQIERTKNIYKKEKFKINNIKNDIKYLNKVDINKFENQEYSKVQDKIDILNEYIKNFGIKKIEKEILQLIQKGYLQFFVSSIKHYIGNNKDLAIKAIEEDSENICYIHGKIRGDKDFIKSILNSKKLNQNDLNLIEFNNIESIIVFYKWNKEKYGNGTTLIVNKNFRYNILSVLQKIDYPKLNNQQKRIINEIKTISDGVKEVENQITQIKDKIKNNDNYKKQIEEILKSYFGEQINTDGKKYVDKIIKQINSEGIISKEIYNSILEACDHKKEKAKKIIIELKNAKLETITKQQKQEILVGENGEIGNEKFKSFLLINKEGKTIIKSELLKSDFKDFILNNPKRNETIEEYKQRIITQYCNNYNIEPEKNKNITRELILYFDEIKEKIDIEHIDIFVKKLKGEITNKEYQDFLNQKINDSIKNEKQKNQEQKQISEDNKFIKKEEKKEVFYEELKNGEYIIEKNGEKLIISQEEKEIVENNKEALKNLFDFYSFFKELNLESIWKYRTQLFVSMNDSSLNLNDNFFSKQELIKFGNNLIDFINNSRKSLGEKEINLQKSNNLTYIKQELKKYSGANSSLNDKKTFDIYSQDRFGSDLKNLGITGPRGFKIFSFKKIINNKNF